MIERRQPDALQEQAALRECRGELPRVPLELVGVALAIRNHHIGFCTVKVANGAEIVFLVALHVQVTAARAEQDGLEIINPLMQKAARNICCAGTPYRDQSVSSINAARKAPEEWPEMNTRERSAS